MHFKSLIELNLVKAFIIAGDLAVDVVFTRGVSSSFDFTTGLASDTLYIPPADGVAKCFITKRHTTVDGNVVAKLIIKGDIPVVGTELTIGTTVWKVTNSDLTADVVSMLSVAEVSSG